ncbi:unnamed protein product [Cyprideis torosa]|uniref:Uncharacterized protein n=1 Tax=Cyprideis torosa TaxID=163714 RepID=A0A7R8W8Z4_9CRUS|nr:unnamed protein product [Cyprideis torosa]CAG0884834.1 unnamed protein product [Cyprideis torosa]
MLFRLTLCVTLFVVSCLAGTTNRKLKELPRDEWVTTVNGVPVPPEQAGQLIWEDNFDTFNLNRWAHEKTASGGGNWEFQIYDNNRTNSYVKDGNLYILPTLTEERYGQGFCTNGHINLHGGSPADECTNPSWYGCERSGSATNTINPTMSARLRTVNSFSFKYGTLEARAKMPRGDWIWPAIWMLPRHNAYAGWPSSGEIDLVESRGNVDYHFEGQPQIGEKLAGSTLHYGPFWPLNGYENAHAEMIKDQGFGSEFTTYKVEWTPDYIRFSYDGIVIGTIDPGPEGFWSLFPFEQMAPGVKNPWEIGTKMAPFDKEFYIILNVAVGGTNSFFPDGAINGENNSRPKPWSNSASNAMGDFLNAQNEWYPTWNGEDAAMVVDYVRVYALDTQEKTKM